MACVVMAVIITMSLVLGAELGSKANPTTTTYVPRPEWYFFFLFEVLRVIKPPSLVPLATIGVPTHRMILLFLLPFYDRGPERRPERRPIATIDRHLRDRRDGASSPTQGANAGSPTAIELQTPPRIVAAGGQTLAEYEAGKQAVAQSGCLACHKIGDNGNAGPGPNLTKIGARLPRAGDRAHAREPDRADAVVQEPAARKVHSHRHLPLAAQVARPWPPGSGDGSGHARGGPGAGDVRPHRRRLRPR